jgi:hypothetical protein
MIIAHISSDDGESMSLKLWFYFTMEMADPPRR